MANEVKSPLWMNQTFFTDVVRHHASDVKAELTNYQIKPSLTLGEHFGSSMFRVEINYSTSSKPEDLLSVVIKVPPIAGVQAEFSETSPIFEVEQEMYMKPLIEIKALLESVGDFSQIQPKLIYQAVKPHRVIVMEDLGVSGYAKILQPLQHFEDSKMVFERLAKFHAAGFYLIKEKKADFSRFNHSLFHIKDKFIKEKFLLESIDALTDVLHSWGGNEEYVARLKVFRENFMEMGQRLYEPDSDGYNVLNHGDFHIKNLMFKKNGEKLEDIFFLDFQISILANPCVDLFYALYNLISDENRRTRRNEIIRDYHCEFAKTLKRLGFIGKVPSLLDLQMNLVKHGQMEVLKCIVFKIFFFTDAADAQIDEVIGSPDSKKLKVMIYNDPRYKEFIMLELPRLVQMGFL